MQKLHFIIFSKNRACQLDLLLRSIETFFYSLEEIGISVLYTTTDIDFELGYEKLKTKFNWVEFHKEHREAGSFKIQLLRLVQSNVPYLAFLVDDNFFKNNFALQDPVFQIFENRNDILCLSLRLGINIEYCYSLDKKSPPPKFESKGVWKWKGKPGDWSYPMSLDGHIFRVDQIMPLLKKCPYSNPNILESQLSKNPPPLSRMICYDQSRIMNLPLNKVQNIYPNRSGNLDVAKLNDLYFSKNQQIDLEPLKHFVNISPHQELDIQFKLENE